ncbi:MULTISPECIES: M23 family metallopeptidase [Frankia]|uniref:Peptidase (Partial match) n=1 Tax=Frankia alni (strain DSM 45986 / CECT 9034 / ACN14a) TaxID=326424 RepID=Q0RDQ3_FRAAA|nr:MULTISPECIES: M23 family metallopeptidase [Frankia]CAJ64413.1 Putative peptidase (partial match) [Frankia alni ACN14a]
MPRLPRFDPLWLVIPAIALLIAVGWPSRVPINPRASGPPATVAARAADPDGSLPGSEPETGLGTGPQGGALPDDPIAQALAVAQGPVAVTPRAPVQEVGTTNPPPRPIMSPGAPSARTVPSAPAPSASLPGRDAASAPGPDEPFSVHRPPEPGSTRPGDARRPALSPPVASPPGGGALAPRRASPPGASDRLAATTAPAAAAGIPLLRWPLPGPVAVSRAFQRPATPFGPGHRGVDLRASPASAVLAAAAGTVSFAGPVAGRGVVTVDHGTVRTTYEPLRPTVRVGAVVQAGDLLGWITDGHPGCPTTTCLHWGLLHGVEYLDPLRSFRRVPPRLLPLRPG